VKAEIELRSAARGALLAAVAMGVVVVIGIELCSRAHAITRVPMALVGVVALAAALAVYRRESGAVARDGRAILLWAIVAVVGVVTLAIAVVAAPNTWDSMTYHLPRVAHWAAQRSVEHYPTSIDRQLWQPPFAEYFVLLPWVVLGGSDRLANLPSWLAGAGCVVAAVEIARLLGLSVRGRALAALAVATAPTVVLEATSTQTDLVAALWIAIVAYLAIAETVRPTCDAGTYAWLGAAAGLAVGSKGTALPLALPWIAIALVPALGAGRWRRAVTGGALVGVMSLALDAGHFLRNTMIFNGPLGPPNVQALLRPASLAPQVVAGNLVANLLVHLGTPWEPVNAWLANAVAAAHRAVGLDTAVLYPFFGGFRVERWTTHENVAGNPVHLLLALVGAVVAAWTWRATGRAGRTYLVGVALSLVLFAAAVRWQPFNARLETPLFVLLAPALAALVVRLGPLAASGAVAALVVASVPALVMNATRPIVAVDGIVLPGVTSVFRASRSEQYFASRRDALVPFEHLGAALGAARCPRLALASGYDGFEYPLWLVAAPLAPESVFVVNSSAEIRDTSLPAGACLIVLDERPDWQPLAGTPPLTMLWSEGRLALWRETGAVARASYGSGWQVQEMLSQAWPDGQVSP
jgi:hypothetical protein